MFVQTSQEKSIETQVRNNQSQMRHSISRNYLLKKITNDGKDLQFVCLPNLVKPHQVLLRFSFLTYITLSVHSLQFYVFDETNLNFMQESLESHINH